MTVPSAAVTTTESSMQSSTEREQRAVRFARFLALRFSARTRARSSISVPTIAASSRSVASFFFRPGARRRVDHAEHPEHLLLGGDEWDPGVGDHAELADRQVLLEPRVLACVDHDQRLTRRHPVLAKRMTERRLPARSPRLRKPDRAFEKLAMIVDQRNQRHGHAQPLAARRVKRSNAASAGVSSSSLSVSAAKRVLVQQAAEVPVRTGCDCAPDSGLRLGTGWRRWLAFDTGPRPRYGQRSPN